MYSQLQKKTTKETNSDSKSLFKTSGTAGTLAGVLTKICTQPLDFVRTKLQVLDTKRINPITFGYRTIKNEGFLTLYNGLSANLLGSGLHWCFFFIFYESIKYYSKFYYFNDLNIKLPHLIHFTAGWISASFSVLLVNPIWMTKTRLQIQNKNDIIRYKGIIHCLMRVKKEEGIKKWYRGLGSIPFLCLNPAIQFTIYESLKYIITHKYLINKYNINNNTLNNNQLNNYLNSKHYLLMGAVSKTCSTSITYPFTLIRSRMFQHKINNINTINTINNNNNNIILLSDKYKNIIHCFINIYKNEGILGYYKGLSAGLLKTVPSSALTFFFYENITKAINSQTFQNIINY